jgi:hypothetical protein
MTATPPAAACLVFAAVAWLAPPAAAQTVTGEFTLGGTTLRPKHVAAFRVRDPNAPRTIVTYVMLTLTPVDTARIAADLDPYATAINDPAVMRADYLALHVTASGEARLNAHVKDTQYLDATVPAMGMPPGLAATCTENTPTRIACTVKTPKPVKPVDGPSWTLDVTFAAAVASRAPGTPMPAGGGPAGEALLALVQAVGGTELAGILARMTPDQARSYQADYNTPAENLASAKDVLGVRLPKQPRITGGELLAPDRALLEVEGTPFPGTTMLYVVEMRQLDGAWRYASSSTAGILR